MYKIIFFLSLFISIQTSAELMSDSLKYLSSDQLEGRRAGSNGNELATSYLSEKLKEMKISPIAGKYLQSFTIFTEMIKNGKNSLVYNNKNVSFEPISFSTSGSLENSSFVFAGYGITIPKNDPKLKYDDYENINVEGKIVVLFTGDPGIGNRNSVFRDPAYMNYQTLIYKLQNAAQKKAKGVLIIQDPLSIADLDNEPTPYFNNQEGGGKKFSVLAGFTTNKWFNTVLANMSLDTLSLQKSIAKNQSPRSFQLAKKSISLNVHLKKETGRISNVIGIIPGTDPVAKKEVIVLGAHFDHLGYGGQSSMEPSRQPKIHNGADDNASGTSLLLKIAEFYKAKPLKRSLVIVFFNAEEEGLLGSAHFVGSWPRLAAKYGKMYAMINFDMVGRFDKELTLMGTGNAFEWSTILEKLEGNRSLPMKTTKLAVASSDHASFIQAKTPALFFTTGAHEDYHKASDDFEKINFAAMVKLTSYSKALIENIASPATIITFDPDSLSDQDPGRSRGYGAHLGCVPKFGQADDIVGVICTRASVGSPAEKAGLLPGDIIIKIGEVEIKNIYDLTFALKFYRSGDAVTLIWKRDSKILSTEITLSTRNKRKVKNEHKGNHHPATH